ncbi:NAD-dependent epimerase/dehydratase family protein [Pseudomonas asiatica]|uniref:NAD-dependent epimerase/dehydratase family protein n=1 Tax=Pseudomonas asiatica TaxID=2219225 RepID=UPI0025AACA05|nr:NAD-dependent epimerase/dehydratase family protein [Pseudomonas asiatica]MDM9587697.1 NAD-dependent epimerase/dehydratase family protein [Pseudomonas asiatica]
MKVLLTGGTGFVGKAVLEALLQLPLLEVVLASRRPIPFRERVSVFEVSDLANGCTEWCAGLFGVDSVIHTAARVHVMSDQSQDPLAVYRKVNVEATLALAEAAAKSGVKRFIFLSSIKVNGESSAPDAPFCWADTPHPADPYAVSKLEAELGLQAIGKRTGMEITIIRPTLVYGAGVGANFAALMRLAASGVPLPLGGCGNKRSLVYVGNLVDLIITCLEHPGAANQTFIVSDGQDLSIDELLRMLAAALGSNSKMFRFPQALLIMLLALTGRRSISQRLFGSLCVDIRHTQDQLDWLPPFTVEQGVAETVAFFKREQARRKAVDR